MAKKEYSFFQEQTAVVKEYIDEMLGKNFICSGKFPYAVPV